MELKDTGIPGCYEISCKVFSDNRGRFVKTFNDAAYKSLGLRTDWCEEYYSVSREKVIRGMHFQTPPMDHAKLVYCLSGEVLDVVVDLRVGSPTYGEVRSLELSSTIGNALYIPAGLAHGFLSLTAESVMQYKVTSAHSPGHDAGILWSSIPFEWPVEIPILSARDVSHSALSDYQSPFLF